MSRMNEDNLAVVERYAGTVAMSLTFGLVLAWALAALGVHNSFPARFGAGLALEYVAVYVIAEGFEIGFNRCFGEPEIVHEYTDEMPEAEQHIAGS